MTLSPLFWKSTTRPLPTILYILSHKCEILCLGSETACESLWHFKSWRCAYQVNGDFSQKFSIGGAHFLNFFPDKKLLRNAHTHTHTIHCTLASLKMFNCCDWLYRARVQYCPKGKCKKYSNLLIVYFMWIPNTGHFSSEKGTLNNPLFEVLEKRFLM